MEFGLTDGTVRKLVAPLSTVRSKGQGFLGARFTGACILTVRIHNGDHPVDTAVVPDPPPDGVGLDDFIYAEPKPLWSPAGYGGQ